MKNKEVAEKLEALHRDHWSNWSPEEDYAVTQAIEFLREGVVQPNAANDKLRNDITSEDFGVPAQWAERAENYSRWKLSIRPAENS